MQKNYNHKRSIRSSFKYAAGFIEFCVIVFLLNAALGHLNLEKYDKEFAPRSSYPLFVPGKGENEENFVTNPHFKYALNYQSFPKKKDEGTIRIFIVGGSAAYAWPYSEDFGFSGYLQRALDRAEPGKFEIINAAGMSYGSHRVLDALQDIIHFEPDIVIVYSGNNEYVERNVNAGLKKNNVIADRIGDLLSRTNLYRAIRLFLFRLAPTIFIQTMEPDLTDIRKAGFVNRALPSRTNQLDMEVLSNFRNNIIKIINLLNANGVKGIFCTVPSNVADWHPEMTVPRFTNDAQAARWKQLQYEVVTELDELKGGNLDSVGINTILLRQKDQLSEMLELAPDHAGTIFMLGQILMRLGNSELAYQKLIQAKDIDSRPMRALTSFNEAIRAITTNDNLSVVDLEYILGNEMLRGSPTASLFLDYCHLTEKSHKDIAASILPEIKKLTGLNLRIDTLENMIHNDDWGLRQKNENILANEFYAKGITYLHNGNYDEAKKAFQQILTLLPENRGSFISGVYAGLGQIYYNQRDDQRYKEMIFKALDAYPQDQVVMISAGFILLQEGKELEKASDLFHEAIRLNPYAAGAFEGLAQLAMQKGAPQEAVSPYQKALDLDGENPGLWMDLGKAYIAIGEKDKAIQAWQSSLQLDFSNTEAKDLIAKYFQQQ